MDRNRTLLLLLRLLTLLCKFSEQEVKMLIKGSLFLYWMMLLRQMVFKVNHLYLANNSQELTLRLNKSLGN